MLKTPKDLVGKTRRNHTVGKRICRTFMINDDVDSSFDDTAAVDALRTAFPDTRQQIVVTHGSTWISVELRPVDTPTGC